jgi:hypothetical protein
MFNFPSHNLFLLVLQFILTNQDFKFEREHILKEETIRCLLKWFMIIFVPIQGVQKMYPRMIVRKEWNVRPKHFKLLVRENKKCQITKILFIYCFFFLTHLILCMIVKLTKCPTHDAMSDCKWTWINSIYFYIVNNQGNVKQLFIMKLFIMCMKKTWRNHMDTILLNCPNSQKGINIWGVGEINK